MAEAGCKRNTFCPASINHQFTASSIQDVSGRLRTQATVKMLAGGAAELLQNKKMQSSRTRGRKTNIPGFWCPFVDP